jgi:hypothetical protein
MARRIRKAVDPDTLLEQIEARVRPTICETWGTRQGHRVEGRISHEDFEAMVGMIKGLQSAYWLATLPHAGEA